MSDKMREQFTKWAAGKFEIPESLIVWTGESPDDGYPIKVVNEQGEGSEEVDALFGIAWLAFQASRAALVVELPELSRPPKLEDYDFRKESSTYKLDCAAHDASADAVRLCRKALTKAGVTAK